MKDEVILCVPLYLRGASKSCFFSQSFLRYQILLRVSAPPRCNWFSPCLRASVVGFGFGCGSATPCLRGGFWSLVVARLRCGEKVFLRYTHSMARGWESKSVESQME